jgi:hypothetical protein
MLSRYNIARTRTYGKDKLEKTLVAHAYMISCASPNESVRLVLGKAFAEFQDKIGIKGIQTEANRWQFKWPCRDGLREMGSEMEQRL